MGLAHVGLVNRDPCECKVKGFRAVSSIERNVSKRRPLQGVRQRVCENSCIFFLAIYLGILRSSLGYSSLAPFPCALGFCALVCFGIHNLVRELGRDSG